MTLFRGSTGVRIIVFTLLLVVVAPTRLVILGSVAHIFSGTDFWYVGSNDGNDQQKCAMINDPHVQLDAMRCELRENY